MTSSLGLAGRPSAPSPLDCVRVESEARTEAAEVVGALWQRARTAAFPSLQMPVVAVQTQQGVVLVIHQADLPALTECAGALTEMLDMP